MARSDTILDALLTRTKQGILAATLMSPGRLWYLRELARHLGLPPSSLQRDLAQLVDVGILIRSENGNRVLYQADPDSPIFPELSILFLKTAGLVDVLRRALEPLLKQIDLAFVYGSMASGELRSDSDIDVMIIGRLGLSDVAIALSGIRYQLGREVSPAVYTTEEFQKQFSSDSHFLKTVVASNLVYICGNKNDLERLTSRPKDKDPQNRGARSLRSASHRRT